MEQCRGLLIRILVLSWAPIALSLDIFSYLPMRITCLFLNLCALCPKTL